MSRWSESHSGGGKRGRWSGHAGSDRKSAETMAYERFADMMIEHIKGVQEDWSKPWFCEGVKPARNMQGRLYNGSNALMLMMLMQKEGWKIPVFGTFQGITYLNYKIDKSGNRVPAVDADGNKLPTVSINKGEHSFPVILPTFTVVHKDTKERIRYDDYKKLSEEEKQDWNVYPKMQVHQVFNLAGQTNIKDSRPELYDKLVAEHTIERVQTAEGEMFTFEPLDRMVSDNLYVCPIKPTYGNAAYYSPVNDEIVVPERRQFNDGELYCSNLLHEMAHATGSESRLNRIKLGATMDDPAYQTEELVAELTAAYVSASHGFAKHLKDDSAAYLKSWLDTLQKEPSFIKNVLYQVRQASQFIDVRIGMVEELIEKEKNGESVDLSDFRKRIKDQNPVPVAGEDSDSVDCVDDMEDTVGEEKKHAGIDIDDDGVLEANECHEETSKEPEARHRRWAR